MARQSGEFVMLSGLNNGTFRAQIAPELFHLFQRILFRTLHRSQNDVRSAEEVSLAVYTAAFFGTSHRMTTHEINSMSFREGMNFSADFFFYAAGVNEN